LPTCTTIGTLPPPFRDGAPVIVNVPSAFVTSYAPTKPPV
jgi:hypothetical protein